MRLTFWVLTLLIPTTFFAQDNLAYLPSSYDDSEEKAVMIEAIESQYLIDIKQLDKRKDKDILETYEERKDALVRRIENDAFIFDPLVTDYFQPIFDVIVSSNPELAALNPRLLIGRLPYPNAYCVGDGTLVFNLELLSRLDNESQVAFVLAHELAHLKLDHVNNTIKKNVAMLNSISVKKEIRQIARQEYNQFQALSEFMRKKVFADRYHKREHESEADALGVEYLKKTKYHTDGALQCLLNLDKINKEDSISAIDLKRHFDLEAYPFKDKWLEKEEVFKFSDSDELIDWEEDSLKTHPDCIPRKEKLEAMLADYPNTGKQLQIRDINQFELLQKRSEFEKVEAYFHLGNLGTGLFYTLKLIEKYPDEPYLKGLVGRIFYEMYISQEDHALSKIVPHSNPNYKDAYNEILDFIHNLRLSEISKIGFYYIQNAKEKHKYNEDIIWAEYLTANIREDIKIANSAKEVYKELFPDGKYIKLLEELENSGK